MSISISIASRRPCHYLPAAIAAIHSLWGLCIHRYCIYMDGHIQVDGPRCIQYNTHKMGSHWVLLFYSILVFVIQCGSRIIHRDHFVYVPRQWETKFHCNVVSHWLDTYTKWSLNTVNFLPNKSQQAPHSLSMRWNVFNNDILRLGYTYIHQWCGLPLIQVMTHHLYFTKTNVKFSVVYDKGKNKWNWNWCAKLKMLLTMKN